VWLARDDAWDPEAERLHGVSREMLAKEGQPPGEVVRQLDALIGDKAVVTDTGAAGRDADCLTELARVAGLSGWPSCWALVPQDAGTLIRRQAQAAGTGAQLLAMAEAEPLATHAAAEDALHYAWRWCIAAGQAMGQVRISPASLYRRRMA
jgi:hypothetical protein